MTTEEKKPRKTAPGRKLTGGTLNPVPGGVNVSIRKLLPAKRSSHMKAIVDTWSKELMLVLLSLLGSRAQSQPFDDMTSQAQLERTIASLDTALFDAYNRCDSKKFRSFFADDLEFYHSQDGRIAGRNTLTKNIEENVCGGDVRRELVPGSLEVHRMEGYGAVQIGIHRFHHPKSNRPTGQGRFINLWQYKDGRWKITRVISFDHHIPTK